MYCTQSLAPRSSRTTRTAPKVVRRKKRSDVIILVNILRKRAAHPNQFKNLSVQSSAILSLYKCFGEALFSGKKVATRRQCTPNYDKHVRAVATNNVVRVWLGGYGKLVGHAVYISCRKQRLRDMTLMDLRMEGAPATWTVADFCRIWLGGCSIDLVVWVFHFVFFPLQGGAASSSKPGSSTE